MASISSPGAVKVFEGSREKRLKNRLFCFQGVKAKIAKLAASVLKTFITLNRNFLEEMELVEKKTIAL